MNYEYYLENIMVNTNQTNETLEDIGNDIETIITNQNMIKTTLTNILHINACIVMAISLSMIEKFIERCLKC